MSLLFSRRRRKLAVSCLERTRDDLDSLYPAILKEGYLILRDCES
jgi:hypothetical protein